MYTNIDRIRILRNKYYDYNKQFLSLHGDPEVVVRHDDDGYSATFPTSAQRKCHVHPISVSLWY